MIGRPVLVKEIVSDEKDKPVLNEEILGKLLEAAWVLQEHNREQQRLDLNLELHSEQLREEQQANRFAAPIPEVPFPADAPSSAPSNPEDYTSTLAQIVETQHQIQLRQLDLESAMAIVLNRLLDITKASGASVGVLQGKLVHYRAGVGSAALPLGSDVEKERALCADCLRSGQVTRCLDISSEFLLDVEECKRRGIRSLIAVPVYHEGGVAGALELYFASANIFQEPDVHSCQLMAGLVTEALAREEEQGWKKSLAEERAVMLDALEKIKPNLAALAGEQSYASGSAAAAASLKKIVCRTCGEELVAGEQYCGGCGAPRPSEEPSLPSDPSLKLPARASDAVGIASDPQEKSAEAAKSTAAISETPVAGGTGEKEKDSELVASSTALTTAEEHQAWTSAAKARDFLEQLEQSRKESAFARFWSARRGDVYLAVAVILVAIVIRWGIWSERSVSATGNATSSGSTHRRVADPDADLSLFDKMLISVGLADAPETPENKGNPEIQVWIDLHTALYYCPGADLYGKTARGRYTSQRDAQLDQFEPAYRKACE
jgi:GAF domain-containing protein